MSVYIEFLCVDKKTAVCIKHTAVCHIADKFILLR